MFEEQRPPLVGWSAVANSPEMVETIKKNKRSAVGWTWVFTLLFPVGFLIAGLLSDEVPPLSEALIIGSGLGLLMLAINSWRIAGMKSQFGMAWSRISWRKSAINATTIIVPANRIWSTSC